MGIYRLPNGSVSGAHAPLETACPRAARDAIYRIGRTRFGNLNRRGQFDQFKVRPVVGPKCFSGVLVHRHLQGEPVYDATFGRKRIAR